MDTTWTFWGLAWGSSEFSNLTVCFGESAYTAANTMRWILLTALKANMGNALPDAARVHREYYKDIRSGELLEKKQCTLLLTPWGGLY